MTIAESSPASVLWDEYRNTRSQESRDKLVIFYAPLVKYVAGKLGSGLPSHVERADLASSGIFGLIQAIERFDPERGLKFETFAIHRIRGSILDELRAIDWVPRSVRSLARRVEEAFAYLEIQLGRNPSDSEVAALIGISESELQKVYSQISYTSVVALEKVLSTLETSASLGRSGGSDSSSAQPGPALERKESESMVRQAIATLGEREKTVLVLYYYENFTLSEIGSILGVTVGRVSQIHTKAVFQLKAKLLRREW